MRRDRKWACESETAGRENAKRETRRMRGSDCENRKMFSGRRNRIHSGRGLKVEVVVGCCTGASAASSHLLIFLGYSPAKVRSERAKVAGDGARGRVAK